MNNTYFLILIAALLLAFVLLIVLSYIFPANEEGEDEDTDEKEE